MTNRVNHFKLGLFVLAGIAALIGMILVLGSGKLFEQHIVIETYIDESINGLERGSPIKYRGVKVGSVRTISFVHRRYPTAPDPQRRYVYVECHVQRDILLETKEGTWDLDEEVARGLRIRPTSQGLTGQLFLEMDYWSPDSSPALPISWQPNAMYVPSAPSTMSRIERAITSISDALQGTGENDETIGGLVRANLSEVQKLLARINEVMADPAIETIIPDAAKTVRSVQNIVSRSEEDIVLAATDFRAAAMKFNTAATQLEDYMEGSQGQDDITSVSRTLGNLNEASAEVSVAASRLNATIGRVNALTAGQQGNIQAILQDTRTLLLNLRELSDQAKRNPSGVLLSDPPNPVDPMRSQ